MDLKRIPAAEILWASVTTDTRRCPPLPPHQAIPACAGQPEGACAHINLLHWSGGERGGGARLTPARPEPEEPCLAWLLAQSPGRSRSLAGHCWLWLARTGHSEPQPVPAWPAVLAATLWFQSSPLRPQDQTYIQSKIHNRLQTLSSLKVNLVLQFII